jgi:hypothetical protein
LAWLQLPASGDCHPTAVRRYGEGPRTKGCGSDAQRFAHREYVATSSRAQLLNGVRHVVHRDIPCSKHHQAVVVRAPALCAGLILQPFLSRHLLDCGHLVRLREVRVAL